MSTVKEIESAITRFSLQDKREVQEWLADLLEDELEVAPAFKEKIERAQREISDGIVCRTRSTPDSR